MMMIKLVAQEIIVGLGDEDGIIITFVAGQEDLVRYIQC